MQITQKTIAFCKDDGYHRATQEMDVAMVGNESPIVLPPGVSQRQVAEAIGVSISTISRTLAGHPRVSSRTRGQVQTAIAELVANGPAGRGGGPSG
jgi:hypothetical protein